MSKSLKLLFGLAVSAGCLYYVLKDFHFSDLAEPIQMAEWGWFVPGTVVYVTNMLLRSLRWKFLVSPLRSVKTFFLFPVLMTGYLINYVLPARAGEVARCVALSRLTGVPLGAAFGTVALERILDLFSFFLILISIMLFLPQITWPIHRIGLIIGVFAVGMLALILFVRSARGNDKLQSIAWAKKILTFFESLIAGFSSLKSFSKLFPILIISFAIWFNEIVQVYILCRVFNLDFSFMQATVVLSGICIGYMIPAAPGAVGTMEFFGREALRILGLISATSVSFLILLHLYQIMMIFMLGLPCLYILSFSNNRE